MKLRLIFSGILLSLCGYSFGANSNLIQFPGKEFANLIPVSYYLQAAKVVGRKPNGDLHIHCLNEISDNHFQWLKKIADVSQESEKSLKDLCTTIDPLDLASLLVSARFLEISPKIQIIMMETLIKSNVPFAELGLTPNGDLDLRRGNIIPPHHFEWLKEIDDASKESMEALKKACVSIGSLDLGSLLASARLLRIDQSTQTTMIQTLTESLCQNPSNAPSIDQQLKIDPISKVAVIEGIIKRGFPTASIKTVSPIEGISISPDAKWIITTHTGHEHANLFRTTPELSRLGQLPFFGWKPQKIFFDESGETITIVTEHIIVAFKTGDLTSSVITRKKADELFTFRNQDNTIHDAKPTPGYEQVTILYKDKKLETLTKNHIPLPTRLPDNSDGLFNLFAYHPDYSNNSVVATTEFRKPDTTQVWNHLTGQTLYSVRTTEQEPIVAISFKQLFANMVLALRQEKRVTFWHHEDPSSPYETHDSKEPIKAMSVSKPHNFFYSHPDPRVQACLSPDGNFLALGTTNTDKTGTVEFSSNPKKLNVPSIVAALKMINQNQ